MLLRRCHVSDICSAVVASMEQCVQPSNKQTGMLLDANPMPNEARNGNGSIVLPQLNAPAAYTGPTPLQGAANVTNVVDDDPAPRSEVCVSLCVFLYKHAYSHWELIKKKQIGITGS